MNNSIQNITTEILIKYLAGETTEKENQDVKKWINQSDKNKKEFNSFEKLWKLSGSVKALEDIDIKKEWATFENKISIKKSKVISIKNIIQIAASVLVIFSLSFIGIKYFSTHSYKTRYTEIKTFELPDGSIVKMNSNSKILYQKDFGITNRNLKLTGEAFFKVKADKNLPFIISVGNTKVEVLGTQFNIVRNKEQKEVKVLVTEGTVRFYEYQNPENEVILQKGEVAVYNQNKKDIFKNDQQNLNEIAWVTKRIDFENTTMKQVAIILEKTYHKELVLDKNIEDCKITVILDNLELKNVLDILHSTLQLKFVEKGSKIYVSGQGC